MTDLTAPLTELRAAYRAYQNAKRNKKEEIHEKYRSRIEDEIRAAVNEEKYAFASLLKDRKEFYDLKVTDIQDHVLRTRNWRVWEDIRDFADIPPESIVRTNAKEARERENAVFLWSEDYQTLSVKKNSKGVVLDPAVIYYMGNLRKMGSYWVADAEDDDYELAVRKADESYAFLKMVTAEIQRVIDAGLLDNPEHRG